MKTWKKGHKNNLNATDTGKKYHFSEDMSRCNGNEAPANSTRGFHKPDDDSS